jgi:hypothetical protein
VRSKSADVLGKLLVTELVTSKSVCCLKTSSGPGASLAPPGGILKGKATEARRRSGIIKKIKEPENQATGTREEGV